VARYLHEAGGKVIAVADRKGATHNEKGLDIPRLTGHIARGGSLTDFEGGGPCFSGPNFLTLPCDVLVPAALGGVITAPIAQRMQCKVRRMEGGGTVCAREGGEGGGTAEAGAGGGNNRAHCAGKRVLLCCAAIACKPLNAAAAATAAAAAATAAAAAGCD
jgi:hypothetical protein